MGHNKGRRESHEGAVEVFVSVNVDLKTKRVVIIIIIKYLQGII